MELPITRIGTGLLLVASGALLYAASWQRWSGACAWAQDEGAQCLPRQDHRYDVLLTSEPWEPVGVAAELAGWSLLVLALAALLLPAATSGRRPGVASAALSVAVAAALADVGIATLRSGLAGELVDPVSGGVAGTLWVLAYPALVVVLAVGSHGWARAAAVLLLLATPLVAAFTYAVGPYDAQPWWEAYMAVLVATSGLCLVVAAARHSSGPVFVSDRYTQPCSVSRHICRSMSRVTSSLVPLIRAFVLMP